MTLQAVVFFVVAFLAFLGALLLVLYRHPVIATLGMAVSTISVGVLYVMLHVPFLGLFQIIVYAGSVMVIALYIIMALGVEELGPQVGKAQTVLTYISSLLLLAYLYRVHGERRAALTMQLAATALAPWRRVNYACLWRLLVVRSGDPPWEYETV